MTNSADLASCESADIQRRILELIEGASSIAISGHTSPDGDALGSVLGLGLSLMKIFPNKDIALLLADDDPVPRIYRFMEGSDRLVPASAYAGNPDLFISVDVPVVERLNNSAEVLRRSKHVVCFDHHPAREEFAELSLRRVDAAACAMMPLSPSSRSMSATAATSSPRRCAKMALVVRKRLSCSSKGRASK